MTVDNLRQTSAPTPRMDASQAGTSAPRGLRLRLKPATGPAGLCRGHGGRDQHNSSPNSRSCLQPLSPRAGTVDRVIYDETSWAPASLRMEFGRRSVILEGSSTDSTNTPSVIGEGLGTLVLPVVPPTPTQPARTRP
jgi:hypothetical protein